MKQIDSVLGSWDIKGDEVAICKHPNGTDHVLGAGSYGQVYKGLRDGIQDVAVKILFEGDAHAMTSFIQARRRPPRRGHCTRTHDDKLEKSWSNSARNARNDAHCIVH